MMNYELRITNYEIGGGRDMIVRMTKYRRAGL